MTEPRAVSEQELIYFRREKQRSHLHLIFPFAEIVYKATVNQTFTEASGYLDMLTWVDYTHVSGTLADVLVDMTMLVGTSDGAYDLGICRIRKTPTASRFYIGEESEVKWQDGAYLTILNDFQIWPKHVVITGGNILMDADIDYSDQLTNYDPIPIMGSDGVLELTGATINFSPAPAASTVIGSTISSYSWVATGASATSGMNTQTPTFTYNAPGTYRYDLTVVAANGKSYTGYRFVHVYNKASPPIDDFVLSNFTGSLMDGDWSFDVEMADDATRTLIRDRSKVILFSDDWYGITKISIGQQLGRENVKCEGWISEESIAQDPEQGTVRFSVRGPAYWMKRITGFPIGLEQCVKTSAEWTESKSLTVNKAVFFLLHWRSTLTRVCDVNLSDNTLYSKEFYTTASDLWTQIIEIAQNSIIANPAFDRYGRFYLCVEPQAVPTGSRTWTNVMTIEKQDWVAPLDFVRKIMHEMSMLLLSGMSVSANNESSAFFSLANGHVYKRFGKPDTMPKMLVGSQAQSNVLAGNVIAWKNNELSEIPIKLSAANFMFDIAPRMYAAITISAADNVRGFGYTGNLIPRSITYEYNYESGTFLPTITPEAETSVDINMNGDIPDTEDWDMSFPPFHEFDNFEMPVIDLPIYYPPNLETGIHPRKVVIGSNFGVFTTETFDSISPLWQYNNQGLTDYQKMGIGKLLVTPAGAMYIFCGGGTQANQFVLACSGFGGIWRTIMVPTDYPPVLYGGLWRTDYANILGMGIDPTNNDKIMIFGGPTWTEGLPTYGVAYLTYASKDGIEVPVLTDDGTGNPIHPKSQPACPIRSEGGWTVLYSNISGIAGTGTNPYIMRFTDGGVGIEGDSSGLGYAVHGLGIGSSSKVVGWPGAINGFKIFDGITGTDHSNLNPSSVQEISFSPDGTCAMGTDSTKSYIPYKSEDSGVTWQETQLYCTEDQCLPTGIDVYENCGDNYRWIVGGGSEIWFTPDRGDSFVNKLGNLLDIAPGIDIQHIRYLAS